MALTDATSGYPPIAQRLRGRGVQVGHVDEPVWPESVPEIDAALSLRPVEQQNTEAGQTLAEILAENALLGLDEPSTWADIEALAMLPGPHCFRDPSGIRIFGSVAPAQVRGMGVGATRSVGLTLTETDWSETVA